MRIRFHFRLIPFVVTVVLMAVGISLAQWQTRRAEQRNQAQTQLTARSQEPVLKLDARPVSPDQAEFRRVVATGTFNRNWPIYLDNRPQNGRPGFYVLMPLTLAGSSTSVLVQRGWIPLNRSDRNKLLPFPTPDGEVTITGVARRHASRVMQFSGATPVAPGAIIQNVQIDELARAAQLTLQPILIEQTSVAGDLADGLVRDWPKPSSGADQNRGYAFQWYALALMAFIFFIVTGIKRDRDQVEEIKHD